MKKKINFSNFAQKKNVLQQGMAEMKQAIVLKHTL